MRKDTMPGTNSGQFGKGNREMPTRELSSGEALKLGKTLAQIARDKLTLPAIEKLHAILTSPNTKDSDAIAAARLAIERGWGSVTNKVELDIVPKDLEALSDKELQAIAQGIIIPGEAEQLETH